MRLSIFEPFEYNKKAIQSGKAFEEFHAERRIAGENEGLFHPRNIFFITGILERMAFYVDLSHVR